MTAHLSAEIAPLAALARARASVAEYFGPLLADADEVIQVAACLTMIERKAMRWTHHDAIVGLSRFGAVKAAAFSFFQSLWEHGLAAKVAASEAEPETVAEQALMAARLAFDDIACARAWRAFYLALGAPEALLREYEHTYNAGGAALALPLAVRGLVINPHDPINAYRLMHVCIDMRRPDLVAEIGAVFAAADLHPRVSTVFAAWASLIEGDAKLAAERLRQAAATRPAPATIATQLASTAQRLNADILDALGEYRSAYAAYQDLNKVARTNLPDLASLKRRMSTVAAIQVPRLPLEDRKNWITMTGFPRSGTTLLENALARHPAIETFEELPTRAAMQLYLDRELPLAKSTRDRERIFTESRRRYYDEMERRAKKPSASVFIDKSPLRSADAGFMVKAFPGQRYIFSIRHPYDVVMSCFKQAFAPNMSMEIFRTFDNAVGFYDFSMSQWFGAYRLDDPNIHYLRYDDLVTQFEPRMKAVLEFLGLDWDPAVLDFADAAKERASATPSYQKVRQGLSIGVQSSWRNYGFLFQSDAARPLRRWVEHFGYDAG